MSKVIVSTHCNRPDISRIWCDKLRQCEDIENYELFICAEPNDEVISVVESIDFCSTHIIKNPKVLGCNLNNRQALETGFSKSDFIIAVESDVLISKDSLVQLERIRQEQIDSDYVSVSLFNRYFHTNPDSYTPSSFSNIEESDGFKCFAYGAWRDRFLPVLDVMCDKTCLSCQESPNLYYGVFVASDFSNIKLSDQLYKKIINGFTHFTYDVVVDRYFRHFRKKHLKFSLGRCINIGTGEFTGTNVTTDDQWWLDNVQCDFWADNMVSK